MDPQPQTAPEVFTEIALSLSGGGYRAAAFHLGALRLLHELDLLRNVKVLSTVSGGTIVGAAWACSLADREDFPDFEPEFRSFLMGAHVIDRSLEKLKDSETVNEGRMMPSLIRAAASVYNGEDLLEGRLFGDLEVVTQGDAAGRPSTQLREISFNATDFRSGGSFRFQQSGSSKVHSGNKRFPVDPATNANIRIADIVAASSCFPSGFEPLRFPADFEWGGAAELDSVRAALGDKFASEVGLMDGGVFDNQGVDSVGLIYERKDREIGVYIISDTSQRNAVLLETKPSPNKGRLSLANTALLLWGLSVLGVATAIALAADAYTSFLRGGLSPWRALFLYALPILFCFGVGFALYKLRTGVRNLLLEVNEQAGIDVWANLKDFPLVAVAEMVRTRARSVVAMSTSVFMKRIRDLGYKRIYGDSKFENKRISNMIYDLDNRPQWRDYVKEAGIVPPRGLRWLARIAEEYPTNLWFKDEAEIERLVTCGEATMCFNIMRYLLECRSDALGGGTPERALYDRAKAHWDTLQGKGGYVPKGNRT